MRKRAIAIEGLGSRAAIAGTEAMVEMLAEVTPVDTSEAVSNWQVSLGAPVSGPIGPHRPGKKGSTRMASMSVTVREAKEALNAKTPGQPIHLSNVVPHIKYLDEGSSSQFPGGFVPRAVLVFRLAVENVRKNIYGEGSRG